MNLFDQLVAEALRNQPVLSPLRLVVEKELLHHDILRIMSQNKLLTQLTFIGGTCLRACYSGIRLSEGLDFTGGQNFTHDMLAMIGDILVDNLKQKYGLQIQVSYPTKEIGNVSTWKIKIITKPKRKHVPEQRINIDVCALPSYERRPMMLINPYGVNMGTSGLVIQAQSLEEIYADKLIAFALRLNRIKYRDLWDIIWMHQRGIKPHIQLIPKKLQDRNISNADFINSFNQRVGWLSDDNKHRQEFRKEMTRFLSSEQLMINHDDLWECIVNLVCDFRQQLSNH